MKSYVALLIFLLSTQFENGFGECQNDHRQQGAGVELPWTDSRRVILVFGKPIYSKSTGTALYWRSIIIQYAHLIRRQFDRN